MSGRVTHRSLALLVAGVLLAGVFGLRFAQSARADTTFGSYSAIASAPGIEFTEDEPSAQAHPEGQGDVPYTTSLVSNGGLGYGLSTIAWPGAYGGNAGSLVLVALPSQVGGVPVPDAIKGAVGTVSPALQYPIRAESRAGSSPDANYSQIPGTTLVSHADPNDSHAIADVKGATQPGVTYGNMHSDSSSTLNGNSVKAVANSVLQNIDIGDGAVKIKSLVSTATATTDSSNASANGGTILKGVTVGGQGATIDQDGLHIGSSNQPANAAASQAANQVLAGLGMKIYVSQPVLERQGGDVTYQASSIVFTWIPPNNPSKNVFLLTLGGARVAVGAGQGFDLGAIAAPSTDTGAVPDTGSTDTGVLGASASAPVDTGLTSGAPASATSTGGTRGRPGAVRQLNGRTIAATFGGVGVGWLLLGVAAAVLLGVGARRLITDLVDNPAATCPLEVRR